MKKKLSDSIIKLGHEHKAVYHQVYAKIVQYDRIAIFRHSTPDYDAFGSQLGLATWIKDNFPNKEVICLGDSHIMYTHQVYPEMDKIKEEWFKKPFLGIFVDVANSKRIADPRYKYATDTIKIDHHPDIENFAKTKIIDTSVVACAELISNMLLNFKGKFVFSKLAAEYFYTGIVGDSGGFRYDGTSTHTFDIASFLVSCGIDVTSLTQKMFLKPANDLDIKKYVMNNYKLSEHGVAYYVLPDKVQKELGVETEQGKEVINLFANIKGVNCWISVTEDVTDNNWRVSLRSLDTPINEVASHFGGGGHPFASGAKLKKLEELPLLIKELDDLFVKGSN